jgi:hypothetical protein
MSKGEGNVGRVVGHESKRGELVGAADNESGKTECAEGDFAHTDYRA